MISNCLRFTMNAYSGFQIILIAELHRSDASIKVTLNQLTWLASLNFLSPIGSMANGFVVQHLGNRFTMLLASVFFLAAWLVFYYATSLWMLVTGQIISAVFSGALKMPVNTYVSEISQAHLRGSFLATSFLASTLGMFFSVLLGSSHHWRTVALVNGLFPILTFVMILFIPESPLWLASKGRHEEAQQALSWFRGWVPTASVKLEYRSLVEHFEQLENSLQLQQRRGLRPYLQRSFYLPLATMSLVFFIHFFSGVSAVTMYSMLLFARMDSPASPSALTAAMGGLRVAGALVVLLSIRFAGKRGLVFASLVVAGCCYLAIAGVGFAGCSSELSRWLPPLGLELAIFANAAGVETIVHMLNSEIFPASIRYVSSAAASSVGSVLQSIVSKVFLYLLDALGLPGLFLYFASMNALGILVYYFIFPETEGRTLKEIEEHYGGIRNLKDRTKAGSCNSSDPLL